MKTRLFITVIMAAVALGFCSCSDDDGGSPKKNDEKTDIILSRSEQELLLSENEFAFDFFGEMAEINQDKNMLISPLSLSINLSMIANGAQGDTYSQIANTLFGEGSDASIADINEFHKHIYNDLVNADARTTYTSANSIWFNTGLDVKSNFNETVYDYYATETYVADLSSEQTRTDINSWCAGKTNDMIPEFLEDVLRGVDVALFNALYFKGSWAKKFNPSKTKKEEFICYNGARTKVDMMNSIEHFGYVENDDFQFAKLQYGNGAYEMVVALPKVEGALSEEIRKLDAETWGNLQYSHEAEVIFSMPRFEAEFDSDTQLSGIVLPKMGIVDLFNKSVADLSGIADGAPSVGKIRQVTAIIVNEEGTEIAAVTGSTGTTVNVPKQVTLNLNRPFIYVIQESTSGAILFMGTVNKL